MPPGQFAAFRCVVTIEHMTDTEREYKGPTVYIIHTAVVGFEHSSYTVDEDAGNVNVSIRANIPGGLPPGEVSFTTVDGSATGI